MFNCTQFGNFETILDVLDAPLAILGVIWALLACVWSFIVTVFAIPDASWPFVILFTMIGISSATLDNKWVVFGTSLAFVDSFLHSRCQFGKARMLRITPRIKCFFKKPRVLGPAKLGLKSEIKFF